MTKHKQILIVEDDNVLREGLQELLQEAGYMVLTAQNGQQALCFLKAQGADIILSDQNMPHLTGSQLLKKVRESPSLFHIPFILMSDHGKRRNTIQPNAFLQKPFSAEALFLLLTTLLQPRQSQKHV